MAQLFNAWSIEAMYQRQWRRSDGTFQIECDPAQTHPKHSRLQWTATVNGLGYAMAVIIPDNEICEDDVLSILHNADNLLQRITNEPDPEDDFGGALRGIIRIDMMEN